MRMVYNEETDVLVILNPTGNELVHEKKYRNSVSVNYDIYGEPIALEVEEASIVLGVPKKILKKITEVRL